MKFTKDIVKINRLFFIVLIILSIIGIYYLFNYFFNRSYEGYDTGDTAKGYNNLAKLTSKVNVVLPEILTALGKVSPEILQKLDSQLGHNLGNVSPELQKLMKEINTILTSHNIDMKTVYSAIEETTDVNHMESHKRMHFRNLEMQAREIVEKQYKKQMSESSEQGRIKVQNGWAPDYDSKEFKDKVIKMYEELKSKSLEENPNLDFMNNIPNVPGPEGGMGSNAAGRLLVFENQKVVN